MLELRTARKVYSIARMDVILTIFGFHANDQRLMLMKINHSPIQQSINAPYLLFVGNARSRIDAKTAAGIAYWRPELCRGQLRLDVATVDLGLPDLSIQQAAAEGVRTLVLGLAMPGGNVSADWVQPIVEALRLGLDVASGLHTSLSGDPEIQDALKASSGTLIEIRKMNLEYPVAGYRKRSGKRLLTVGTDCSIGKMHTALAIEAALKGAGRSVDFRATGQTGILIAGRGIPIDAIIADFVAGAAEALSPDANPEHWDIIEGQGSLFHPSYAGVTLGLIHGSQPDALVLCHEPGRFANSDFADLPLPSLEECAELHLRMARMVNPAARLVGISLNTSGLEEKLASLHLQQAEDALGVPAIDPNRTGVATIIEELDRC